MHLHKMSSQSIQLTGGVCYSLKVIAKNASVSEEFDHCVCLFLKPKRTGVSFPYKLGNHSKPSVPCKQQAMKILFYLSQL